MSDIKNRKIFSPKIVRTQSDAGKTSLFKGSEGWIILGTCSGDTMEFYHSKGTNIFDGFETETKVIPSELGGSRTPVIQQNNGKTIVIDLFNVENQTF